MVRAHGAPLAVAASMPFSLVEAEQRTTPLLSSMICAYMFLFDLRAPPGQRQSARLVDSRGKRSGSTARATLAGSLVRGYVLCV